MSNISQLLEKNKHHSEILHSAGKLASDTGIAAFVVGGYVRDALLGRDNKDIDIMVDGNGIQFAEKLSKILGINIVVPYDKFGTALIPHPEVEIEIATARTETYQPNSRKPKVEFSTVEEDMSRRDFTVNAIAASILPSNFGELVDPFRGILDLHNGKLITPLDPDETFRDDPLRMLRAARFSAQLNFTIDEKTLDSITRQKSRLEIISKERITEEISKTLKSVKPSIGFLVMKRTGLLQYAFPELDILSGVEVIDNKGHKDIFLHTLKVVDNTAKLSSNVNLRFAALVHDIAKPRTKRFVKGKGWTFHGHDEIGSRMLKKISRRMKLSNELRDYLMLLTKLHLRPITLAMDGITDSAVRRVMFEAGELVDDLMILCRADITTKNPNKVTKYMGNFERVEKFMQDVKLRDELRAFQSPVRGDVIMKDLGLEPGPSIGKIKKAIENAILDNKIPNEYDSAYKYMLTIKDEILTTNFPKSKNKGIK
ncbi:MAG: HD domain-containing protein [Candidatus Marinimicrobia bacterium]|nr:HD domain-containing protein [Candidatus Neomarinimicrobiota bacterium]MBL7023664.1 HD domain-containing protein [Candidatus Neomarinimicrobiota bacterium]MBL7109845.1 HD domain-containing protein [Candidatus Neomarinimicrobiota bacterium]